MESSALLYVASGTNLPLGYACKYSRYAAMAAPTSAGSGSTGTAVGAAVAINVARSANIATIGTGSNITAGTFGNSLLAQSPYLYVATSRADTMSKAPGAMMR